ncbi:hypothetical protein PCANC_26120 [Puccinia coronata f. sp. avenae]|uniref:Glucanase n=1 Tax=Puccinia coronata f. sp. avenae TaxID=200324 RepID=A0A2N5TNV4_9BASI|nr:hypothetical protein PCANC_26120 [Puccinia coronata f. sp. avenae]PLW32033.1 hypothetical protein PCASD_22167 [Puccinia coronata f. sp. avenae]
MKTCHWHILILQFYKVLAQQIGIHLLHESPPALKIQSCRSDIECSEKRLSITLDADLRPLQVLEGIESCVSEEERAWNATYCADSERCAEKCSLGGVKYKSVHGVTTHDHSVNLRLFTRGKLTESRVYLLGNKKRYHLFHLKNRQFSFEVDASQVPCGVDAALYFTSMQADGGLSRTNRAGAMYGTGYCDAQCPTSLRFIDGKANIEGSGELGNQVFENLGACCPELDLWEGNALMQAYGAHPCVFPSISTCEGVGCTAKGGLCDQSGCGFASQKVDGNGFYGPNKTIDTQHKFTVVTQFHTSNGTDLGELVEIRQFFVQHGVLIPQQGLRLPGQDFFDSINKSFCESVTTRSENEFQNRGGMEAISRAMDQGLVLVMGIWTGEVTNTLGSIQKVPATRRASLRTINEGICPRETRTQPFVQKHYPHASVKFSNLRIEPINSSWVGLTQHHPVPAHEHKVL